MLDAGCGIASCLLLCPPIAATQLAWLTRVAEGSQTSRDSASVARSDMHLECTTGPSPTVRTVTATTTLATRSIPLIS